MAVGVESCLTVTVSNFLKVITLLPHTTCNRSFKFKPNYFSGNTGSFLYCDGGIVIDHLQHNDTVCTTHEKDNKIKETKRQKKHN